MLRRLVLDGRQAPRSRPSSNLRQDVFLDPHRRRLRALPLLSSPSSRSGPRRRRDVDDADPPTRKQSEIITDHNNVKDLYQRYKQATNKDEKATLVNTSALAPSVSPRRRSLTLILVRALQVIHELAVHSEAEEVRAPLVSPPASCRAASLTLRAPARRQVSVYNDLEKRGLASESKLLRDEHEELEKQLYSVDWTKVDSADFAPSARASSPPLSWVVHRLT